MIAPIAFVGRTASFRFGMKINLGQFGRTLVGREAGREAFAAAQANTLRQLPSDDLIEVDFTGVDVLTSSWAEEFLHALQKEYGARIRLLPPDNPAVQLTLDFIGQSPTR